MGRICNSKIPAVMLMGKFPIEMQELMKSGIKLPI
jgi:hypothetical protein